MIAVALSLQPGDALTAPPYSTRAGRHLLIYKWLALIFAAFAALIFGVRGERFFNMLATSRPSYFLALRTNDWTTHENPKYRLTKVKRALFIEHDHVTLSGPLWRAFKNRGYEVVRMPVVKAENFETPNVQVEWPDFSEYDVIVPMGSPWGVWEDERIGNWLLPELERVTASHNAGQPIFGVCFGGQLMARALGG